MLYDISPQDFAHHVRHATGWKDLEIRCGCETDDFGRTKNTNMIRQIKKKAINMKLNLDHFRYLRQSRQNRYTQGNKINNDKISNDKIFVVDSQYTQTNNIKKRLIRDFDRPYECNACKNANFTKRDGVLMWNDQEIHLQLEHINGVNNDNRLENLTFLCPNCHSQTNTFCGKNGKKNKVINAWVEDGKTSHAPGSISSLLN